MKSRTIAIALFLVLFTTLVSCSKDNGKDPDPRGKGFMRCKMNGKQYEFNSGINANQKPIPGEPIHFVVVAGWEKNSGDYNEYSKSPSFDISLLVPDKGAEIKTYSTPLTNGIELDGQYCIQHYEGDKQWTTCYTSSRSEISGFTLTITELNDWGVSGTFSGTLKDGAVIYKVTEGAFSAPYNGG